MKKKLLFFLFAALIATMAFSQTVTLYVENPGFEDPDDNVKYTTLSNGDILGWMTDDVTNDNTGREAGTELDASGKYWCYMNGNAGEIYQSDMDVIPSTAATYVVTLNARLGWVTNAGDIIHSRIFIDAYTSDPVERAAIDSFDYTWAGLGKTTLIASFNIPAGSPFAGQKLCLGYKLRNENPTRVNADWGQIDSVSMTRTAVTGINDIPSSSVFVYPNPSSNGVFKVKNIQSGSKIEVFDISGNLIKTEVAKSNNMIDLSGKQHGIYFLKSKSNNKVITQKMVSK
jgi:hypothetical protein